MGQLLIDVTEFVGNPIRTGIQRVVRELLTHWPHDVDRQIVRFDERAGGLLPVHDDLVAMLIDSARDARFDIARIREKTQAFQAATKLSPIEIGPEDKILVPELFASLARSRFYHALSQRGTPIMAIVYDFLAWTRPDALNISFVGGLNDYLVFLSVATRRCHIAQSVCDAYVQRFLRRPSADEIVISLGADALGVRPDELAVKPQLICLGALDGRKGQDRVYRAYLACPPSKRLPLIFAGRVPDQPRDIMGPLLNSDCPMVSILNDPDDIELAHLIASSRGALFPSRFEGFGLPALESLHLGTPVVIDAALPAVSGLSAAGQIRLETATDEEMTKALIAMSNPTTARRLREEASALTLPTWAGYAAQVAAWVLE